METVAGPGPSIRFIDELVRYPPADVQYIFMSWARLLLGSYDVLHFHWPEHLIRGSSALKSFVKRVLFRILLFRLSLVRTPIVRTVHNVEPHTPLTPRDAHLLDLLFSRTTTFVVMSDCTPVNPETHAVRIPHGDFREPLSHYSRSPKVRGRVLLFGRIERYKGALDLLKAAEEIGDSAVEIRIAGNPTPEMRRAIDKELSKPSRCGARVSTNLRWIPDDELVAEYSAAELIVLPYKDAGNGNSGVALTALSLERPVLTPDSCLMRDLAAEAGPGWVNVYEGRLTGDFIMRALEVARGLKEGEGPLLQGRDWHSISSAYASTFRQAATLKR